MPLHMKDLEGNKIIAAILIALLLGKISGMMGRTLVHPHKIDKNVFVIEGATPSSSGETAKAGMDAGPPPLEPLLAKANPERGKEIAKKCLQCHTFDKGGPNRVGPNLWNVVGAKHGHTAGFSYSSALLAKAGVWDLKALNEFLYKPRAYIPGTKMSFVGLSKAEERADLIAYLMRCHDAPLPKIAP